MWVLLEHLSVSERGCEIPNQKIYVWLSGVYIQLSQNANILGKVSLYLWSGIMDLSAKLSIASNLVLQRCHIKPFS